MSAKWNSFISCSNVCFSSWGQNDFASLSHLKQFINIDVDRLAEQPAKAIKRAGKLSKAVLNHIFLRQEQVSYDYCVFVSRFGELDSIERNNEDNTVREELSPASFSYSVHNAIACLYAIVSGAKIPSTSLSVGQGAIKLALLESLSFLCSHSDDKNVLVVVYDGFMPDRYKPQFPIYPNDFVLSFSAHIGNRDASAILLSGELYKLKSLEDELYLLSELAGCHNKHVPMEKRHMSTDTKIVGENGKISYEH